MTKITKREKMGMIMKVLETMELDNKAMLIEFCQKEIEGLNKKASTPRPTNEQDKIAMDTIIEVLQENYGKGYQVKTLQESFKDRGLGTDKMSNQKISAILNKMVGLGLIQKTKDKKTTLFGLGIATETTENESKE